MSSSSNSSSGGAKKSKITTGADRTELFQEIDYQPLDLDSIYDSIEKLFERVPVVPENGFRKEENGGNGSDSPRDPSLPPLRNPQTQYSQSQIVEWAMELKIVIDELQLLIALISPAVYKWGTDRSGAQDQNHSGTSVFCFSLSLSSSPFLCRLTQCSQYYGVNLCVHKSTY